MKQIGLTHSSSFVLIILLEEINGCQIAKALYEGEVEKIKYTHIPERGVYNQIELPLPIPNRILFSKKTWGKRINL